MFLGLTRLGIEPESTVFIDTKFLFFKLALVFSRLLVFTLLQLLFCSSKKILNTPIKIKLYGMPVVYGKKFYNQLVTLLAQTVSIN